MIYSFNSSAAGTDTTYVIATGIVFVLFSPDSISSSGYKAKNKRFCPGFERGTDLRINVRVERYHNTPALLYRYQTPLLL